MNFERTTNNQTDRCTTTMNTTNTPQAGSVNSSPMDSSPPDTLTSAASPTSNPPTLKDTSSVTSSPESEAGRSPCNSPDGLTTDLFGQALAHASHTATPGKDSETPTPATSGPCSSTSSAGAALNTSLANRLKARFAMVGSMEYQQTWKEKVTPAGRSYSAHTASARRTSGNDCTGWPTVSTEDHKTDGPVVMGKIEEAIAKGEPIPTTCQRLRNFAQLAGWPTASSRDWKDTPGMATTGVNPDGSERTRLDQLPRVATLAGGPTASARDFKGESGTGRQERKGNPSDTPANAAATVPGLTPFGTPAATESTAASRLNPRFSLWLMGFPDGWACSGERAMQSSRKQPRRSSKP